MPDTNTQTGFAEVNGAKLYYELAGNGKNFVMVHAGVADCRQWNNEFTYFSNRYRVLRYDMRGYGKSEPVEGKFNIQDDLQALLDTLNISEPIILMGCSIGAGLAIDFALEFPERVEALIIVGGAPQGYDIDIEDPPLFADLREAYEGGDLDLIAEIEAKIWFDGQNRTPDQVNPSMRQLALDMNRLALKHEAKNLGEHVRKSHQPANERLHLLTIPTLVVIGEHDIPFLLAAADHLKAQLPNAKKTIIPDSAHLPNMEQPVLFQQAIDAFLAE